MGPIIVIFFIIVAVVMLVGGAYLYIKEAREKNNLQKCSSCGYVYGGFSGESLVKIVVERYHYSYNGDEYEVKYYFKCSNCGHEDTATGRIRPEYSIDILDEVRKQAYEQFGISSFNIPRYKVEIKR